MAQAPRSFAIDFNRGLIFSNPSSEAAYQLKYFTAGDIDSFLVYIVQSAASTGGPGALTSIASTGLTLKVALGLRTSGTSTVYTSVTLTPDSGGKYFVGDLPLNVAGVTGLFTSDASDKTVDLEFELTDNNKSTTVLVSAVIHQQVIPTNLQDTAPPDTAIGRQEATGTFVSQVNNNPSIPFQMIVNDSDGTGRQYVLYISGGALRLDPIGT